MTTGNLYDALRESHERQRGLCRRLLRSKPGTRARIELFAALRLELAAHEAAEERYLYVPMLMDDAGLDASRHALHEHHEIDERMAELQSLDPRGEPWLEKARGLSQQVHHHLREEERKFFQLSGKILGAAAKLRYAAGYRRDYARMLRKLAAE